MRSRLKFLLCVLESFELRVGDSCLLFSPYFSRTASSSYSGMTAALGSVLSLSSLVYSSPHKKPCKNDSKSIDSFFSCGAAFFADCEMTFWMTDFLLGTPVNDVEGLALAVALTTTLDCSANATGQLSNMVQKAQQRHLMTGIISSAAVDL